MRLSGIALFLTIAAATASAQRFSIGEIDAEKPAGQLLQLIGQEPDEAKKVALMEQFVAKFPGDKALGAVYEQMQAAYIKANQPDKVMETTEKLLALDPTYDVAGHQGLQAAQAKKDPDLIKKW